MPVVWHVIKRALQPRDRSGEILFIDARKMGVMVDRTRRELTEADINKIADVYPAWRGEKDAGTYEDVPGFCKTRQNWKKSNLMGLFLRQVVMSARGGGR